MFDPQDMPKPTRITSSELSRQARIANRAQNHQEGLGFVCEYKLGGGTQTPMFETPAAAPKANPRK
jgi:hypothetical protein